MIHEQVYQTPIEMIRRNIGMLYQRSRAIEQRLETVLSMIRTGGYSTPQIAEELGVSVPTVSRAICALKERGHQIRAERDNDGWRYVLDEPAGSPSARVLTEARR
jgi:biotin operon repressor